MANTCLEPPNLQLALLKSIRKLNTNPNLGVTSREKFRRWLKLSGCKGRPSGSTRIPWYLSSALGSSSSAGAAQGAEAAIAASGLAETVEALLVKALPPWVSSRPAERVYFEHWGLGLGTGIGEAGMEIFKF